ncbi:hypothetical protein BGX38DRAFT_1211795 [Terfezia claveryi]|nr:hypothetical protein BGX38DRAFT_1211795 [Terfezia claveryi]
MSSLSIRLWSGDVLSFGFWRRYGRHVRIYVLFFLPNLKHLKYPLSQHHGSHNACE